MNHPDLLDSRGRPRVVITGVGAVSALGIGADALWTGLKGGRSGVGRITLFDASDFTCQIAAQVPELPDVPEQVGPYQVFGRPYLFAVAAAQEALAMAGVADSGIPRHRRAVYYSGGSADLLLEVIGQVAYDVAGPGGEASELTPDDLLPHYANAPQLRHMDHTSGALLPPMLGVLAEAGTVLCLSTACAGGSHAIGNAVRLIRDGDADLALAGGGDCLVTRQIVSGFSRLSALATSYNDNPTAASRPFDAEREGFVLGEGVGLLVLESLQSALERGAEILAEMGGVGLSGDAYRLTDPEPGGTGAEMSMRRAIEDAGLQPTDVDYVNAHGTSTSMNDAAETRALKLVLGDHAYKIPVSSTKSMAGHPIHGAGALESVVCVQSIREQIVHPTFNWENRDPDCDLDYVPLEARQTPVTAVLNNAFGFGGQNTTLLLKRFA